MKSRQPILNKFLMVAALASASLLVFANSYITYADTTSTDATASSSTPTDVMTSSTSALDISSSTASTTPSAAAAAADSSSSAVVATGDAAAVSDITNVINVNLTDSQGLIQFLNLIGAYTGTINFSGAGGVSCNGCNAATLQTEIDNNNSSTLENDVSAVASSGANAVDGNGAIATGNAFAASNLVNIANTNITNSNYVLVVFNSASDVNGDIVLPGKDFFMNASSTIENANSSLSVANNNTSTLNNNLDVQASSGGNTANGSSTAITTGSAATASNVLNLVNSNITDGEPVVVLIRVFGTWNGSVMSAPAGLYWQQTPDGLMLTGSAAKDVFSTSTTSVANTNNASVTNNVKVYALTGQNELTGNGTINTGNAAAAGNVINILNTNIYGKNILLALVNIFGNWNGNLAFGQPDLWVGTQANVDIAPLQAGEPVTYTVTVANRGTADATNVRLAASDSSPNMATVTDPGTGTLPDATSTTGVFQAPTSSVYWNIPVLPAGATMTFKYTETMSSAAANAGSFTEAVSANEHEDDATPADNTDTISFPTGWFTNGNLRDSDLAVHESNDALSALAPSSTVNFALNVMNKIDGGIANGVTLYQTLTGPDGKIISGNTLHIGQIYPGGKKMIHWDAQFPADALPGTYVSTDKIEAYDVVGAKFFTTSSTIVINPPTVP